MALLLRIALLVSALTLLLVPAANAGLGPLGGSASCGGTIERPFRPWLDASAYVLAPDGGFENGAAGWALTGGAKVVGGNESFHVRGRSDSRSLLLPPGSTAMSPPVCMELTRPWLRLFARSPQAPLSLVRVQVVSRGLLGVLGIVDGGLVGATPSWQPSLPLTMLSAALTSPLGTKSVQFKFTALGATSTQIDDVYVDPWAVR